MTVWTDDTVNAVNAQAERRRQRHPIGSRLEQLQRADRDMKARLRDRLEKADETALYGALYELVDVVPDLVDSALTEAGVKA